MDDKAEAADRDGLTQARETIARQAQEIGRLRRQVASARLADGLREALILSATAGAIASPTTPSRLSEMIVQTAAHVISARAAALFLVDEDAQELVFEVALGSKAEEVREFRLPLGHGIAGLVAVSGQPMAVSDAKSDPRQASDISESVGYAPESILCVPLFYEDRVVGVLELLDKEGSPSFSASDMEALGLFANQSAVAIEQSRLHQNLAALLVGALESFSGEPDGEGEVVRRRAGALATSVEEDPEFERALELARLVQEIASQGENEREACRAILRGFAEYLRLRPDPGDKFGGIG